MKMAAPLPSAHKLVLVLTVILLWLSAPLLSQEAAPAKEPQQVLDYISKGWDVLSRAPQECKTVLDGRNPDNSYLYVPAEVSITDDMKALETKCKIHVVHLPKQIQKHGDLANEKFNPPGLLYLPNAYVVPGGFFNEMYGWDSYFIILGLLQSDRLELARGMVDNFLYEIEHYGAILNANRTYFLSRSQPPFLTSMIMAVHESNKKKGLDDHNWLARAYPLAVKDYELWTNAPHLAGDTGLSRYYDLGEGPGPEITDGNDSYYRDVAAQLEKHPDWNDGFLVPAGSVKQPADWPTFKLSLCAKGSADCQPKEYVFTQDYYKGDRSDRESGYDITFRFAPFSGKTHHYAAVCLNSLLFKAETDLAELSKVSGHEGDSTKWKQKANQRHAAMDKYLWDQKAGMYFDYDFQTKQRKPYVYATTFFPMWAGIASPQQAKKVAENLKKLERAGGLAMSDFESGVQWDLPYGWAPLQLVAADGLRRYGFTEDANRLSAAWLSTVVENFKRDGTIREKYNMITRSSQARVTAGYQTNVVGFGWTNGVFLELMSRVPADVKAKVLK